MFLTNHPKELKELKKLEKKGKKNGITLQTFENPSVSPQPQNFNNNNQFQQVGGYPNNFPQENDVNQYHQQPPVYQQQDPSFGMNQQPQQAGREDLLEGLITVRQYRNNILNLIQ